MSPLPPKNAPYHEHQEEQVDQEDQAQCPPGCCTGDEILCISIPCPITIVLLGLELQLNLPCLSLTSVDNLSTSQVEQLLGFLANLLGNLGSGVALQASE